jgi:hypothetical protein
MEVGRRDLRGAHRGRVDRAVGGMTEASVGVE